MNNLSQPSKGGAVVTQNFHSVLKESSLSIDGDNNVNRLRTRTRSSSYVLAQEPGHVIQLQVESTANQRLEGGVMHQGY